MEMVKKASKIGKYGDSFRENYKRIPKIIDKLTPEEIGKLVDAFYNCYSAERRKVKSGLIRPIRFLMTFR